jgi:ParB family transcriptional regulator, chromosome partitioning protein
MNNSTINEDNNMSKNALGKGLSALLSPNEDNLDNKEINNPYEMSLNIIIPGISQPREYFEEDALQELSESIKKNGIIQPILVRKTKDSDFYEIIAGERRFRAANIIGLKTVPVIIRELGDRQSLELALIENIQRENLTAIEEADGYKRLQREFNYTQEQLAEILGKSRSHIANMLRLLTLPQTVKDMINKGLISMSHARILVSSENPEALAEQIIRDGINVRDAEKLATGSGYAGGSVKSKKPSVNQNNRKNSAQKDEDLIELERSLSENIGLKVEIEDTNNGGRVVLHFNNLTELDKILQKIG